MYYSQLYGHRLRRLIHLSIGIVPFLYYWKLLPNLIQLKLSIITLLGCFLFLILVLEVFRLTLGILFPGQRDYEKKQISGFTWGTIGVVTIFLFAPIYGIRGAAFGGPLIWSWVLGDPILGECRRSEFSTLMTISLGSIAIATIWILSTLFLNTPVWIIPIILPVTLLAEWIKIPYVDDNFTMLVLPLVFVLVLTSG